MELNPPPAPPRPAVVPSTLFTQIFALVLATAVVAQLLSVVLLARLSDADAQAPAPGIAAVVRAIRTHDTQLLEFVPLAVAPPPQAGDAAALRLRAQLAAGLGRPPADLRVQGADPAARPGRDFRLALRTPSGWLQIRPRENPAAPREMRFLLLFLITAFAMLPAAWLFARRLARPFEQLADAAERVGRDPSSATPAPRGPLEVVRAADAMAGMQQRLRAYVADRTQMLGAIAHDLRTPLMRLAFRAEALPVEARAPIAADIAEMEAIMQATLDFARAESTASHQPLEMLSLVEKLCDDLAATGDPVRLLGGVPAVVAGDPVQLRRLLGNLIANAIAYGARADVRVGLADNRVEVEVLDRGPGIPAAELEHVFAPFYRLEASRSRATGGTGLGLAVVRSIAHAHGGEVRLENRAGGGLCARLGLPRLAAVAAVAADRRRV